MLLQRFEEKTLPLALDRVRAACGADALVIETRPTRTGYVVIAARPEARSIQRDQTGALPFVSKWTRGFGPLATTATDFGLSAPILRAVENALLGTKVDLSTTRDPSLPSLATQVLAALVRVEPAGPKRFNARFRFPEGREASYTLAGDELYVDAHILKWKPIANLLGLHTAYELDRVAGRYRAVAEEQAAMRTVYALAPERPVDLFELRQRYSLLSPLLDVEYGSATFVVADEVAEFEIRVSTTGLMARRLQVKAN